MKKREDFSKEMEEFSKIAADSGWQGTENSAIKSKNEPEKPNAVNKTAENIPDYTDSSPEQQKTGGNTAEEQEKPASGSNSKEETEKNLSPEEKIAQLEAKLAESNDNYLRKAADFENFRKRMNLEKSNAIDYANQTLLLDLVTVIDDFERAIKSAETHREAAGNDSEKIAASYYSLYEGISMIEKSLISQLENKWGLKRFDSAGEVFDPNRHEAIMMEKSEEIEEPLVAEEFIKGYFLKDRVIRPAKVKVVMPEK